MRKSVSKLVAVAAAAALVLSGCGGGGSNTTSTTAAGGDTTTEASAENGGAAENVTPAGDPITDLVTWETTNREIETFNILYSQLATDLQVLTNLTDGLLSADAHGNLIPALAEEWGSEDGGITWTFKLREGVKWVDVNGNEKADCNAQDFITGLEWILNYHKNDSANTSMPIELIKGAGDYYEYTKSLSAEEAQSMDNSKFLEMVGLSAPDDYTLVYTCVSEKPYFDTVTLYNCLYPAPKALIDELGVDGFKAMNNENMWYNGCYTMTSYIQGNEKVMTKNPMYWDQDCTLFDTVTVKMVESKDVLYNLYQSGEIDNVDLTESNLTTINNNPNNEYYNQLVERRPTKYSYQIHFVYAKNNEDGSADTNWNTAVKNTAFRQSWYYGLDLETFYARTNAINPLKCENNAYTMKGLVTMSDGTEYVSYVENLLGLKAYDGETMRRLDATKAQELKAQAMEELSAQGVTFPIAVDYYIQAGNQTAIDTATVLKQAISNTLGDDYVTLNIKTYVSSLAKEVREPRLASFYINGWGADYGDPQNYLGQETYGEDNAYYSVNYSLANELTEADGEIYEIYNKFTEMVNAANAINDDLDARYKAYAEAEAYMLQNALVVPCYYDIQWQLTRVNDYTKSNAMYGIQNTKYKNWETSVDAYTTEQYDAIAAAFEASAN
ncbi:MAG: ABC transporter substrate-binding protein [bacterium]|nr:ABC transporter substrate-binding protein [bacterium]